MEWSTPFKRATPEFTIDDQLHNPEAGRPHWSTNVGWRDGRWDQMRSAPQRGYPIMHVRGRTKAGDIIEKMHRAHSDGDGYQPAFDGWFAPYSDATAGFYQVHPIEWQPLWARP